MSNPFKDWTPQKIAEHNIRVLSQRKKPNDPAQAGSTAPQPHQPQSKLQQQPLGPVEKSEVHPAGDHRGPAEAGDGGAGAGALPELKTLGRVVILITNYRLRLLDEDNLNQKKEIDCLRYARFIADDRPEDVKLFVRQWKVASESEVRTEIEIYPIADNWNLAALFKLPELMARILGNDFTALAELAEMIP